MANPHRSLPFLFTPAVLAELCAMPGAAPAQTPQQLEYERQQREYWRAQEAQRQEQQRLQQQQLDTARRQQEEAARANRPPAGAAPAASYVAPPAGSAAPAAAASGRTATQSAGLPERRYAIADLGYFVVQVPRDWKEQVQQKSPASSPTILYSPASGGAFHVILGPTWPEPKGRAALSREEIRAAVERGAQSAKAWAAESSLPLKEIQGLSGPGFYISATERAVKPGGHRFVTTGVLRVGELAVAFTVTSNDGSGRIVQQTFDVLRTAAHVPAASRAATAGSAASMAPASQAGDGLKPPAAYQCEAERLVVLRCRSEAADAYCSVSYPDRKSAATGGVSPELAERRGELVKKLAGCRLARS